MSYIPRIDFDKVYPLLNVKEDFRFASFIAPLQGETSTTLNLRISDRPNDYDPNAFNLSFGPFTSNNKIDDTILLKYLDNSKVFSTILLFALNYLTKNKDHRLGVDGSNNGRASYYWTMIESNLDYLSNYFDLFGLQYFVRILRIRESQYENPFDFNNILALTTLLEPPLELPDQTFNYFIFRLKQNSKNKFVYHG